MNKNTAIVIIALAILVVGGAIYYNNSNRLEPTSTTISTPTTPTDTTTPIVREAGAPVVTTSDVSFPYETTVVLNGRVTPNGSFTSYWYEYGVSANLGNKSSSPSQTIGSGFLSIPAPVYIAALAKETVYYYRLVAENQYGRVVGNQFSFKTGSNPPPVGSAPTVKTIAASDISRTAGTINGEVTPNKASTQYWFEYGNTTNLGNVSALSAVGDGDVKLKAFLALTNLDPSTTYYYRLNAQNQFGTVNGTILNFKTSGPPAATAPSVTTRVVTNLTASTATLRGTVDPNGAITTYWFEYSTDSVFGAALSSTTVKISAGSGLESKSVETNIIGLISKTNYYYRVVAENNVGLVRGDRITFKTK